MFFRDRTKVLQEAIPGKIESGVGRDGFQDDASDLTGIRLEGFLHGLGSIEGEDDGVIGETLGDTGTVGIAEGQGAGTGFDEERIDVSVIASFELDDLVSLGEPPCDANGRHGGFGSGIAHADHVHAVDVLTDQLRHFDLERSGASDAGTILCGWFDRVDDGVRSVSQDRRAPSPDVVDPFGAVDIPNAATFGAIDEEWGAPDGSKRSNGRIDAPWNSLNGSFEKLC